MYLDTQEPIKNNERQCKKCSEFPTVEGYDACLGFMPNVTSACCGHGVEDAYFVSTDDTKRRLRQAVLEMRQMRSEKSNKKAWSQFKKELSKEEFKTNEAQQEDD